MNRLRRNRPAKIISFILVLIFGALMTANIIFAAVLTNNNLYISDEASVRNKMLSYTAERTINKIVDYFDCKMNYMSSDIFAKDNADYWESEMLIYKSIYSRESSNIFFTVSDSGGFVLLSNFTSAADSSPKAEFVFTRSFTRKVYTNGSGGMFVLPDSTYDRVTRYTDMYDGIAQSDGVSTSAYGEEVSTYGETSATEEEEATLTEAYEPTTSAPTELSSSTTGRGLTAKPLSDSSELLQTEYYEAQDAKGSYVMLELKWDDNASLNGKYLFDAQSGFDGKIYAYCVDDFIIERNSENTSSLIYFQSDYTVTESGEVVSAQSADDANIPAGYTSHTETYTVKLYIPPQAEFTANDMYSFTCKAVSFGVAYRNALIPISIIYMLLLTLCTVFTFYSAGYTKKAEQPFAGGIHRIPLDIAALIYVPIGIITVWVAREFLLYVSTRSSDGEIALGLALLYLFCAVTFIFLESLAVRIRCKTVFKNTVTGRLVRLVSRTVKTKGLAVKTAFVYLAELAVIAAVGLACALINNIIPLFIFALLLLPLTFAFVYEFNVISEGTERFSSGDIGTKITEKLLFGPFKRLAANLNSINDTVNNAVQERLKSENMKTELITNVSHDLKTPLTSIVNYIDLLKKLDIGDATAKEYIEVIDRQSQRLKKLTIDIVDASKASTGNIEVHPEKLDLRVMVSQMDGEYCDKLIESSLSLITDIPESPTYINADGKLLWRIFDNIMSNVCKYSLPGTRVYLTLTESDGMSTVILRNISKNELNIAPEELTERFVRGDSSRNTEGSGLGLSIASSLAELMHGSFKISIDGDLFKVSVAFPSVG